MTEFLSQLLKLVSGKEVAIVCHWDADGITSGALIYHLIKDHCRITHKKSKGDLFQVLPEDIKGNYDFVFCVDIHPSPKLDPKKVIYIDHHPIENKNFAFALHNDKLKSCSLLIWKELIPETSNPYFIFLTLVGYFGDGGAKEHIPSKLRIKADELIPMLMKEKPSIFNGDSYLEIEKYVSLLNAGKRYNWSGDVPLQLLTEITTAEEFTEFQHPLAYELNSYKKELRGLYSMAVDFKELKHIKYSIIDVDKNIQGVLCARHMDDKPILVMNKRNEFFIGSMRAPNDVFFDVGSFLSSFNEKIDSFVGGGHRSAAGFTLHEEDLDKFLEMLHKF